MPKAQCTLCSQMVPLQCLPVHIKHCKMEHVDLCSSSDDTAECPLCKKTFDSDIIEIHAILNWISRKVDQNNTFPICISRNDILSRGMQQLMVTFFGEAGVDSGALIKEFLTDYDSKQLTTGDVTDLEFSLFIEKVNSTDDMSELTDEILSCGYWKIVPMLYQLRKGLQLYDLQKVMEMHPDLCLPLFVPAGKDDRVNHCGDFTMRSFYVTCK
ncbi:hypothetical protein Q7C36_007378 [Tachysurus vachellii]|uniref:HECT domain-containing protein n=1 Tax=Tachysurus vachellii TaxID=175792 RepID=A0AA88N8G3_TACVA|nr:hypothetical protein Q7C36_007378 [Tachysurus vachellii]